MIVTIMRDHSWGCAETHVRRCEPAPSESRRRCRCGCRKRASHMGTANGLAMMGGCKWHVMRWVREKARRKSQVLAAMEGE